MAVQGFNGINFHACDATFISDSASKSLIFVHSSMCSDCDDICDSTFIDISFSKSLITAVLLTHGDCDHSHYMLRKLQE